VPRSPVLYQYTRTTSGEAASHHRNGFQVSSGTNCLHSDLRPFHPPHPWPLVCMIPPVYACIMLCTPQPVACYGIIRLGLVDCFVSIPSLYTAASPSCHFHCRPGSVTSLWLHKLKTTFAQTPRQLCPASVNIPLQAPSLAPCFAKDGWRLFCSSI
jgi:hypothetical protein